jgi:hypothetical protein
VQGKTGAGGAEEQLFAGINKFGGEWRTTLRSGTGNSPGPSLGKRACKDEVQKIPRDPNRHCRNGRRSSPNAHALTLSDALDPLDRYCWSVPPVEAVRCFEMAQAIVRSVSELRKSDVHRVFGQCREILNER